MSKTKKAERLVLCERFDDVSDDAVDSEAHRRHVRYRGRRERPISGFSYTETAPGCYRARPTRSTY